MSKTFTTAAVARMAGCSRSTIRNYSQAGLLTPVILSDRTRVYDAEDIARARAAVDRRKRKPEAEGSR